MFENIIHTQPNILMTAIWAGLGVGAVYALIAIGYNLIYSVTNVFNLAQADIVSWGGLVAFTAVVTHNMPSIVALIFAALVGACLGFVIERIAVAPLTKVVSFG